MNEPSPYKKLRPSGGYRDTASFQTSTLIYDATVWFCEEFVNARSRTVDQMVQAARSGRQSIAEGSRAAAVVAVGDGQREGQRWALYSRWLDAPDGAVQANALVSQIHQANFLPDRQIRQILGKSLLARCVVGRWRCAPPKPGRIQASSFGAAQANRNARALTESKNPANLTNPPNLFSFSAIQPESHFLP